MSTTVVENQIDAAQRFAQQNGQEYHVFSSETMDATVVSKWISVTTPFKVMIDSKTVLRLKNKRLEWQFDENKTISAVVVKDE